MLLCDSNVLVINWDEQLIFLLRIFLGGFLGLLLGWERSRRQKEAGMATHFMVGAAAALFTCVSIAFKTVGSDAARIAAQIVPGVGFLGAGMIFFRRESLRGLTTAAGIWATAAIGMCTAIGHYYLAVGTTVVIIVTQMILHSKLVKKRNNQHFLMVKFYYSDEVKENLLTFFGFNNFHRFKVSKLEEGKLLAETVIHPTQHLSADEISHFLSQNASIISVERLEDL